MTKDYVAVLDACVLVPAALRDTLLRLAETPRLYLPKWSDEILAEVERTLIGQLKKTPEQAAHLTAELKRAFPEALVREYKSVEPALTNHPKDRHVLAAAIRSSAQAIVTFNLKHFPVDGLRQYDVEPLHPDEFLVNQFYLDEALIATKFTEQATAIGRTVEDQLRMFHQTRVLPLFSQTMADTLGIKL
jgi:predicted nucleic acid-binding protein